MTKSIREEYATVIEKMSDTRFRVKLDIDQKIVQGHTSGRMSQKYIKVYPGDKVKVEVPLFSRDNARIVYRCKK